MIVASTSAEVFTDWIFQQATNILNSLHQGKLAYSAKIKAAPLKQEELLWLEQVLAVTQEVNLTWQTVAGDQRFG